MRNEHEGRPPQASSRYRTKLWIQRHQEMTDSELRRELFLVNETKMRPEDRGEEDESHHEKRDAPRPEVRVSPLVERVDHQEKSPSVLRQSVILRERHACDIERRNDPPSPPLSSSREKRVLSHRATWCNQQPQQRRRR